MNAYYNVLQIRRDKYGDNHIDVASTLNSIGLALFKLELYEYALHSFNESLRIRRQLLGPDHRDVSVVLYNVATINLETGNDDEALANYREVLRIERIVLGPNHSDVALTMQHIAHVHQQRGELDDALHYFTESLAIQRKQQRNDKSQKNNEKSAKHYAAIAETLDHIGNVHLQRAQTKDIIDAFSESTRCLRVSGKCDDDLRVSGLNFYGISKMCPEYPAAV